MTTFFDDVRRLRYFLAIAREGSLSAAARALHIAQPALTHHLHELEAQLGRPIALRSSRGIELTDAGRATLEQAEAVVAAVDAAGFALGKHLLATSVVEVRIGMPPSLAPVIAPLLMAATNRLPQGVTLNILDAQTRQSSEMLERDQLDLAIAYTTEEGDDLIGAEKLFLVVAGSNALAKSDAVSLRQMGELEFVLPPRGRPIRDLAETALAADGIKLNVTVELDSLEGRKHMVGAGKVVTLLPLHSISAEVERGNLAAVPIEPCLRRLMALHTNRSRGHFVYDTIRNELRKILHAQSDQFIAPL